MKKILSLLIVSVGVVILSWCWNTIDGNKQPFFVDILSYTNPQSQIVYITKPWKISGKQDIVVSSQVMWRIKSIEKKEGAVVSWDQLIISVADTIANYWIQVERAKSAMSRASLQKQQTQISLDKSFTDTSTALDVAKNNYAVSQLTTQETLKKAQLDLSSALSQSQNLFLQFDLEKNWSLNILDLILNQMDTYLGVSDKYKNINWLYEPYLWAKDLDSKADAKAYVLELYDFREDISNLPSSTKDPKVVLSGLVLIEKSYDKAYQLLDKMKTVLVNSLLSAELSQQQIDGYRAKVDWLLSSLQGSKSSLLAYRRQVTSLLSEDSSGSFVEMTKAQAQIGYDITRINSHNAVFSTEVAVKSAENNYETLEKNKNIQIGMANNAVHEANLSYQDALSRFNNLSVKAPIPWIIWSILVDVWQEITQGTPLFTISNNDQQTIELYITSEERSYLAKNSSVKIIYNDKQFTWSILSVASIADRNTLYKIVIGFENAESLLGDIASVLLPISLPYPVLPLNSVTPIGPDKWFVWLYSWSDLQRQNVILGRVWESYVEILSGLSLWNKIVSNDVSYFDPEKFIITVKK